MLHADFPKIGGHKNQLQDKSYLSNNIEIELNVYPNPSKSISTLEFNLDTENEVELFIYDLKGAIVLNLNYGKMNKGHHQLKCDVSDINQGVYIISLVKGNDVITRKLYVIK